MRKLSGYHARRNFVRLILLALIAPAGSTIAAQLKEARVTRIIKEVQLLPTQAAPRPAVVNDHVRSGTAVRTGADSRTELTFTDLTLTRLGANTIFSFDQGTRNLDLSSGAVLLQVPKGAGGATITTAAVTAAVTGTTVLMEYHRNAYIKLITLEGVARMYIKGRLGESVLVGPGQMVIVNPNAKKLPDPVYVDLKRLVQTCLLITEFGPLASQSLILQEIQNQERNSNLVQTNMVIYGRGTLVSLDDPTNLNAVSQQSAALPSGPPSESGPPNTISSPNPYLITSGTTISTDPTITTNGVTDFGKIYRGRSIDGPASAWAFGSTSAFDTLSGFDDQITDSGAAFKFLSLELTGNPTIITTNGEINLGLIAVNGITSGGPGGVLTFAGIHTLLFATQDGSITLGPEISFSGIPQIDFYARGVGSNLTLGSAISGGALIRLWAQGAIQINGDESATAFRAFSGGDFLAGTGTVTATDVNIQSLSNINIDASKFPDVVGGTIELNAANTLNITLNPGGTFTRSSLTGQGTTINLQFSSPNTFDLGNAAVSFIAGSGGIQAPNVLFANGSSLLLQATGDISINGTQNGAGDTIIAGGAFSAQSDVSANLLQAGTSINVGGELSALSVTAGTDITASDITILNTTGTTSDADVGISAGGQISITNGVDINRKFAAASSGLNVLLNAGTDLTAGGSLTVNVDNSVPGNLTTGANITLNAGGSLTVNGGGDLDLTVMNNNGGHIGAGGNISVATGSSLSTQGFSLLVTNYGDVFGFPGTSVGNIGTGGNIFVTTGGNLATDFIAAFIDNHNGASINSGGTISFNIGGALTTLQGAPSGFSEGESLFLIISNTATTAGGTIGSDATINLTAASVSAGGILDATIGNSNAGIGASGGNIGGSAIINFGVSGDLMAQGDADFEISNFSGAIGSDAMINVTAANLTTQGAASFIIQNQLAMGSIPGTGGTIGSDAMINVTAANLTAGSLLVRINNRNSGVVGSGGTIDSNATINFNIAGNLTTQTGATFDILNTLIAGGTTGGTIGADATINVTAASISPGVDSLGSSLDISILNDGGGNIDGNAIINVGASDITNALGDASFTIDNSNGGTVGGDATLTIIAGSVSTASSFSDQILNNDVGHIGGSGDIFVTTSGDFTAGSIDAEIINREAGSIGSDADLSFNIGGALTTQSDATFGISNRNDGSGGGTVGSNATMAVNAASVSVGGGFTTFVSTNGGGSITGIASNLVNATGDLVAQGPILVTIEDTGFGGSGNFIAGGHIGGAAILTLDAQNITTSSTASGVPGTDVLALEASIYPNASGTVGGDAIVAVSASQNISAPGSALFWVANGNYLNDGPGTIGGNAEVNVSAVDLSTGDFFFQILNYGGASIGGDATLDLNANTVSVNGSLDVLIDNTGGTIGGNATINMNVSGTATTTSDATFQILGNDPSGSAAINFNGGSYTVGSPGSGNTFLSTIDGNGTITFTNASVHADVIKAGVFGANGVLNIGGGVLNADSILELYAPGTNGKLNFTANVTLDGISRKILAANSITIFNNVVVTIGDDISAEVYTNNANYSSQNGGNGTTNGTFGGSGANNPLPLSQAPPFGAPPGGHGRGPAGWSGGIADNNLRTTSSRKPTRTVMNVSNTDQLLALLDSAAPGAGGKITIRAPRSANRSRNPGQINPNGVSRADRRTMDVRTVSSRSSIGASRSPQ